MAFNLSGVLSLDSSRFTSGISKAKSEIGGLSSSMSGAKSSIGSLGSGLKGIGINAIGSLGSVKSLISGFSGLKSVQAVVSGVSKVIKTGFTEASDMEGYKTQLETATKDTEKAGKLMSNAIQFANKTPFETGQVVQATSTMEMYGLSSERWLSDIADMAGATNKDIMQATEAMADVAVSEFERIKEFGIKKDDIMLASAKKYGEGVVFNTQGQVKDQAKLMDTLQEMMQDKYSGGAEKLSKTTKGMWSTVTGVWKTGMASIMGISMEGETAGEIIDGSLMDNIKNVIEGVASAMQSFQGDGTFAKIGENISNGIGAVIEFLTPAANVIKTIFSDIGSTLSTVFSDVDFAGIFESLSSAFSSVWSTIGVVWESIGKPVFDFMAVVGKTAIEVLCTSFSFIADQVSNVFGIVSSLINGDWAGAWESAKSFVSGPIEYIGELISKAKGWISDLASSAKEMFNNSLVGEFVGWGKETFFGGIGEKNANGTSYFRGGLTHYNERGGEIAQFPNGTTIVPADRSKEMTTNGSLNGGKNITVHMSIDARGMSINELADTLEMRLNNM